ncbi:arylsulfatase [Arachidicoccus soli]|uniref:Arylsulfatase n=1 Tax=Arachidicoccus soli TaxID=2341117 RepID=A0A386HRE6_9BACT|nr:arylsulfatase [Arachidicoccus soli]AYD48425.1 arylsulfatase [Arachidicoccus soli]
MNKEEKNKISRKEAFKRLGGLALFPLATSSLGNFKTDWDENPITASVRKGNKETNSPNILFIMDDQHRGDYMGCAGNNWIKTPHIDALAKEGARFANFYCAVPSCTPARTSLLTGLTPWNHGMLGYMNNIAQYYRLTMPQFFSEMGYETIVAGKNHFGPPRNTQGYMSINLEEGWYSKNKNGFICDYEAWFNRVAPGKDINATHLSYNDNRGGVPFPYADELHATYWTAEKAIDFLRKSHKEYPWFLKLSFQRPHPPFDPPKRWMDYYESLELPKPHVSNWAQEKYKNKRTSMLKMPEASSAIFPDDEVKASRAAYAGSISFVDEQIGRVIKTLKETGQYENTFILFCSDHGEMLGDQHMWRKCRPYQPSANVPLIIRWPSNIGHFNYKRGQIRNELVELRDIFPTFADVSDLTIPSKIDGESILKILKETNDWRTSLSLEHSLEYEPDNAWVAIRDDRYKYIFYTLTGFEQLYDLQEDPYELDSIIAETSANNVYKKLYNSLVEELSIRGEVWVKDGKLQIQKKSLLVGNNFPRYKFNQSY